MARIIILISGNGSNLQAVMDAMDNGSLRGAELVLHGHAHTRSLVWLDGPEGKIPTVGVPSASASTTLDVERGGYNLYRIHDGRCEMENRSYEPSDGGIVTTATIDLSRAP